MSTYIELTQENYKEITQEGVVLVDFWAPWCGPCRMISPIIDQLAQEYEGKAKICKVNTEEQEELTVENQVRSVPTILFYKDGQVVDHLIGAVQKAKIVETMNQYL